MQPSSSAKLLGFTCRECRNGWAALVDGGMQWPKYTHLSTCPVPDMQALAQAVAEAAK